MRYSILITYYYNRNNINEIINELKKYKKKNLEILIRNDNPNIHLKLKYNNLKIKIFNEKKKSLGELKSINFLLEKAKGNYISILADDDLISVKVLNNLNKTKNFDAFFSLVSKEKKFFGLNSYLKIKKREIIDYFLNKRFFLSGTVGTFYKKELLIEAIKKIDVKKYNFFFFLLLIFLLNSNYKVIFSNYYFGLNNTYSSKISSGKINLSIYLRDLNNMLKYASKLTNKSTRYYFVKYVITDYYSILFRKKRKNILVRAYSIYLILLRENYLDDIRSKIFFLRFCLKIFLRLFYNFFT